MFIKEIYIKKDDENTKRISLNQGISMVESNSEVYDIIKLLLGNEERKILPYNVRFSAEVELDKTYYFYGEKTQGKELFTFIACFENQEDCTKEYFYNIKQNKELDSALFFDEFRKQNYPDKLLHYNDLLKFYPNGDFSALTNGYGKTRSFRAFLAQYIKYFKPVKLCDDKDLYLKLLPSGKFQVESTNIGDKVNLSESEEMLYHYYSFIGVADFWDRADRIRNMFSVKKPLIVSSFLERMDESINIYEIFKKSDLLERQIIVFVPKTAHLIGYNTSMR